MVFLIDSKKNSARVMGCRCLKIFFMILVYVNPGCSLAAEVSELPQAQYYQYATNGFYMSIWPGVSGGLSASNTTATNKNDNLFFSIPYRVSFAAALKFGRKLGAVRSELEVAYIASLDTTIGFKNSFIEVELPNVTATDPTDPTNNFRIEFTEPAQIEAPGKPTVIRTATSYLLASAINFYYDFEHTFGPLTPFTGAGMGFIYRRTTVKNIDGSKKRDSEGNIMLQVMFGLQYDLKKKLSVGAEIKYIMLPDGSKGFKNALGDLGFYSMLGHIRFSLGFVYRFG